MSFICNVIKDLNKQEKFLTVNELAAEDDGLAVNHRDGECQGVQPQVGVDECRHHPYLGQPQPDGHKLRFRLHKDGDIVTATETQLGEAVGHLVTVVFDLHVGRREGVKIKSG